MRMRTRTCGVVAVFAVLLARAPDPSASAQPPSPRTVLVIHWGAEELPVTPVVNDVLREVLLSDPQVPVDYFSEYFESDEFPPEQASLSLADYIHTKYRGRRIDLVVAVADPALQFAVDHRGDLFPDAPIVYLGLAIPERLASRLDGNVTGVLRDVAYAETLRVALDLHPATERVFVVVKGRNETTNELARAAVRGFSRQVGLTYVNESTVAGLRAVLASIPPRSLVLYIWHTLDDGGHMMHTDEVARLVAQASPVPVYGTNDEYLGLGVVGGVIRDRREMAARLGEIALRILRGARVRDIPLENARLIPIFDWRQVRRWHLDPSRLPSGAQIRFKEPTAWESYREYILGTVVVVAMQLLLIAGLLAQRSRRRRAEETIRTRETTLRSSFERIRQLAGRLINAQEETRAGIARDLHDEVGQELVGISMAVSTLKRSSGCLQDPDMQRVLSDLQRATVDMVDGIRRLSHDLHPATLRLIGLVPALAAHCLEVERRYDVQVRFKAEGHLGQIDPGIALCVFRIAQEALRNGAVHGEARRLGVSIVRCGENIELTVTDDGRGFDVETVRREGGLGLVNMEERAHLVGGQMQIVSARGRGTTILVLVPARAGGAERDDVRVHVNVADSGGPPISTEPS
jgi:signal transduction histidine kinase